MRLNTKDIQINKVETFKIYTLTEHTVKFMAEEVGSAFTSAVYRVALKQPSSSSLVVNHSTADVRVTSDRTVTLVLVLFELSTSISGSHTTTYIVNTYVPQMRVYLR